MNTTALITTTNEMLDANGSRLSVDTWVQIVIAIITLVAAVVACYQSHKANIKSDKANGLASEANRISKTTQALSMNLDLLDRRKDILERIEKCVPSKLGIDILPRVEEENYDVVSMNDIQILFLDNLPITNAFTVFNKSRENISIACKAMKRFYSLCGSISDGEGGLKNDIWETIIIYEDQIQKCENEGASSEELRSQLLEYCHSHKQVDYVTADVVEEYDYITILDDYSKYVRQFDDAQKVLCLKIRGFIKDSIDPTKI